MKNPAHLLRGAFYLVLLLAVSVIPFALAQRTAERQSAIESMPQLPRTSSDSGDKAIGSRQVPRFPARTDFPGGKCGDLYVQYDNPATQPPLGIGSQQFEPAMAAFNDQAADDFVLPQSPLRYQITGVQVMGEYSAGGGPASSFNVFFYTNGADNLPGTQIAAFHNLPYSGTPPNFDISLGFNFILDPGTYWISVQAVQNFNTNGQWFWHNRTIQSNAGAAWQNPGNGYGTGCISWNRKNACMPDQVWPDQVFTIGGCVIPDTPTATATASWTPTSTATFTPTATAAHTPSATPTATVPSTATVPPTPTPTQCTGRCSPTPRPRPTPASRP